MISEGKKHKKGIALIFILLIFSLLFNGIYLYRAYREKYALIVRSYNIESNIMQYLNRIKLSLEEENDEEVQCNMGLLRYECQLMDFTLKELRFLCKPLHKFVYTAPFTDWYQNDLRFKVDDKNLDAIEGYITSYSELKKTLDNIEPEKLSVSKLMFYYESVLGIDIQ